MFKWIKSFFSPRKQIIIPTMQLEDFIANSLIQVCNAIQKAQKNLNPTLIEDEAKKYFLPVVVPHTLSSSTIPDHRKNLYLIEFDLAITVENKQGSTSEGGIFVIGSNLNAKYSISDHQTNTSISRVKLSIPIKYPSAPNSL